MLEVGGNDRDRGLVRSDRRAFVAEHLVLRSAGATLLIHSSPSMTILYDSYVVWLRTNGVNANGAAAKVMNFDRLRKKVHPGTFGKIQVGQRECPKGPSVIKYEICSDPISADPICPFPNGATRLRPRLLALSMIANNK